MRKSLFLFTIVLIASCSSNYLNEEPEMNDSKTENLLTHTVSKRSSETPSYQVTLDMINRYLRISRKDSLVSEIIPIVRGTDTLAYHVQYGELYGWELISGDMRIEPVIVSSPNGTLDIVNNTEPANEAIEGMIEMVGNVKYSGDTLKHSIWQLLEPKTAQITQTLQSRAEFGRGMWIGVDTISEEVTTMTPRLISTKWGQSNPWNYYTPYNNGVHYYVGCGPVAVGQILYKYVKPNPGNFAIPTYAYVPETGDVEFGNYSTEQWGLMAENISEPGIEYTALFLSWLGQEMNATYEEGGTPTTTSAIQNTLTRYLSCNIRDSYDFSTVLSNLRLGSPVLVLAHQSGISSGHAFIIDSYETRTTQFIVRYEFDPEHYITSEEYNRLPQWYFEPPEDNKDNPNGVSEMERITTVSERISIKMNWGWSGSCDNYTFLAKSIYYPLYNGESYSDQYIRIVEPNWYVNGTSYNTVSRVIYGFEYNGN